ncbi:hypothetical protein PIB30_052303 [Stylosanthes scabra]|uniref:Retrotransposon gag domain-containing protein n=1 Tax=Stylosanthes scabra TaxID=79078 RepID=A0ABU6SI31_9FABA|nr:hypothetical protein [Stylosanthes scabra]
MEDEIPINNEGGGESSHPQPTPEKEVDQRNQTIQQLEAALRELLERQSREAAIASEVVKRANELAKRQQAVLDEAERREKDKKEKLNGKAQTLADNDNKIAESTDHTWKPSTVVAKVSGQEKNKHLFSSHILAEELPKKFRMLLVNASDAIQCKAFTKTLKNMRSHGSTPSHPTALSPGETLRSYLDRFNTECTQIEGLQSQAALMALVKGLKEDTPFLKSLTKRLPNMMEEIQERSHDYLQQEEGQIAMKTDRSKKDNSKKESFRDERGRREHKPNRSYYNPLNVSLTQFLNEVSQVERVPAPRPIKNVHRGERGSYCKYHKQNGHDTEECRDLLDFVEQGLKNRKFREYTSRHRHKDDD